MKKQLLVSLLALGTLTPGVAKTMKSFETKNAPDILSKVNLIIRNLEIPKETEQMEDNENINMLMLFKLSALLKRMNEEKEIKKLVETKKYGNKNKIKKLINEANKNFEKIILKTAPLMDISEPIDPNLYTGLKLCLHSAASLIELKNLRSAANDNNPKSSDLLKDLQNNQTKFYKTIHKYEKIQSKIKNQIQPINIQKFTKYVENSFNKNNSVVKNPEKTIKKIFEKRLEQLNKNPIKEIIKEFENIILKISKKFPGIQKSKPTKDDSDLKITIPISKNDFEFCCNNDYFVFDEEGDDVECKIIN